MIIFFHGHRTGSIKNEGTKILFRYISEPLFQCALGILRHVQLKWYKFVASANT